MQERTGLKEMGAFELVFLPSVGRQPLEGKTDNCRSSESTDPFVGAHEEHAGIFYSILRTAHHAQSHLAAARPSSACKDFR